MASPLAHHLPSFASGEAPSASRRLTPLGSKPGKPDMPARSHVADAEERGRREAGDAVRAEYEALRSADRAAFEAALATEREAWRSEVADRLAAMLGDAMRTIEAALADAVARALAPVIEAGARERALRDLVETIQRVKGRRDVAIKISGPAALLEALKAPLASAELAVELAAGDSIDLTATIGDTLIETRIGAWGERLKAALGGRTDG